VFILLLGEQYNSDTGYLMLYVGFYTVRFRFDGIKPNNTKPCRWMFIDCLTTPLAGYDGNMHWHSSRHLNRISEIIMESICNFLKFCNLLKCIRRL